MGTAPPDLIGQLHAALGKVELALGVLDESIGWVDERGVVEWCNSAFDRLVGKPHIYVLGARYLDLLPFAPEGRDSLGEKHPIAVALAGQRRVEGVYEFLPAGPRRLLEVVVIRTQLGTGPAGAVFVLRDITERKLAEQELRQLTEGLERSNRELEQFAYVASHDLQEPLRMVASFCQLLEKRYGDKLDAPAKEFIAYAVDGARRMQGLINDLLVYSRVGTKGKPLVPVDCGGVLRQVLVNLQEVVKESGAQVSHGPLPVVPADEGQLGQLFQNLVGNAIKFHGAEAPRVHVSAEERGGVWVFSVRDNGIGIEPQYHERIFRMFERLHTKSEYPGTGIGLAICRKIVERHGGRIWVESGPGKGAAFHFTVQPRGGPA